MIFENENNTEASVSYGRRRNTPASIYQLGKLPPQATELERAVLGALMQNSSRLHDVMQILTPASFYETRHQKIFSNILSLYEKSNPIDILTVTAQLRTNGELEM